TRLRELQHREEGFATHLAVVVGIGGGRARHRDGDLQPPGCRVGRIETQPGIETGQAPGERFALVHAAEGQRRARRLHVVAGKGGRDAKRRSQDEHGKKEGAWVHGGPHGEGAGGSAGGRRRPGSIRTRVASCWNRWCQTAAAACASTSTTSAQNIHSCQVSASSSSASLRPVICGTRNRPNQRSGKPDAELITQPLTGMASNSRYSAPWVAVAMRCCHTGVPGSGAGAPAYRRHAPRNNINASMSRPSDLCSE